MPPHNVAGVLPLHLVFPGPAAAIDWARRARPRQGGKD